MRRPLRRTPRNAAAYRRYVLQLYAVCAEDAEALRAAYARLAPMRELGYIKERVILRHRKLFREYRTLRQDMPTILHPEARQMSRSATDS